jgi:hypothetical protein
VGATTVAPVAVADTRCWVGGLIDGYACIYSKVHTYMQTVRMFTCIRYEEAMCHQSSNYLRRGVRRKGMVTRREGCYRSHLVR